MGRKALAVVLVMLGVAFLAAPLLAQSPLQVTISGTSGVKIFGTGTRYASWSTSVSGGYPPYRYQWYWNGHPVNSSVGTGPTFGGTYYGSEYPGSWTDVVSVVVTDNYGQTASDSHSIAVTMYGGGGGGLEPR